MQRVTNCLIIDHDKVLLLKKPRHGWYAMPGGKMEPRETVQESVIREVFEETGLKITNWNGSNFVTYQRFQQRRVTGSFMSMH